MEEKKNRYWEKTKKKGDSVPRQKRDGRGRKSWEEGENERRKYWRNTKATSEGKYAKK